MKRRDLIIIAAILALDLSSKMIVQTTLELHKQIPIIQNFFYLNYVKNTGAAWSIFSGKTSILTFVSLAGIILFTVMYKKTPKNDKVEQILLAVIIAGTAGNFVDRAMLGYVRDFLDFYIFGYDFPIFNVADMALCIGIGLLFLKTLLKKEGPNGEN